MIPPGLCQPRSGFEEAWVRFKSLQNAISVRKNFEDRIDKFEALTKSLEEESFRIKADNLINTMGLLNKLEDIKAEMDDQRSRADYCNGLYETTYDEYQSAVTHAKLHERDRDLEIRTLLTELDLAFARIRRLELDSGIPYSKPERFTRLDPKSIPVVTYEKMPPSEPSNLMWRCQACDRPISLCICSN